MVVTNKGVDAGIGIESLREGIVKGLIVTVVVELYGDDDWIYVCECCLIKARLKEISPMQ